MYPMHKRLKFWRCITGLLNFVAVVTEVDRARNLSDINTSYDTIPHDTIAELNVDGVFDSPKPDSPKKIVIRIYNYIF